jgi:hypothetical protein
VIAQAIFERKVLAHIVASLADSQSKGLVVEGLVLSGGCAMNQVLNEKIRLRLPRGISMFVGKTSVRWPFAPHACDEYAPPILAGSNTIDSGLAAGAALFASPPTKGDLPSSVLYVGLRAADMPELRSLIAAPGSAFEPLHEAAARPAGFSLDEIVPLLLRGHLVAVFRGRQEFGLSKWGRRSVLGAATSLQAVHAMQAHTKTPTWMTMPTIMTDRFARHFFGDPSLRADGFSSFARMSANPNCSAAARLLCGTTLLCLTQVVAADHDEWTYALLEALAEQSGTGAAVLFASGLGNRYNSVADALGWLSKAARMSHALFDDTLLVRRADERPHSDPVARDVVPQAEAQAWSARLSSCSRDMPTADRAGAGVGAGAGAGAGAGVAAEVHRATGSGLRPRQAAGARLSLLVLGLSLLVC